MKLTIQSLQSRDDTWENKGQLEVGGYFRLTSMGFTGLNLFSVSSSEIPENAEFV